MMKYLRKGILLAAVLLLCLLSASACSAGKKQEDSSSASSEVVSPTLFAEGTSIGGKDISGKTVDEALEIARAAIEENMKTMEITVKFRDDTVSLSKGDFQVKEVLELLQVRQYFDCVVTGDDVKRKKPAPDPYLQVLAQTHMDAEAAVAVEDSKNGVLSAQNAGIFCFGYGADQTSEQDLSMADALITAFSEIKNYF